MNWLKHKKIYLIISGAAIVISVLGLLGWGLRLSLDFTGGTIAEYKFDREISTEELTEKLEEEGLGVPVVQTTGVNTYLLKFPPIDQGQRERVASVASRLVSRNGDSEGAAVEARVEELRFETVGPSIGTELVKKTIYAVLIAAGVLLVWVAYQFKSFKFGVSAILAMLHDSFILIGSFSLLGHFASAEVDFLFVTALLTTLSFSVHDTIVVFDRIREIGRETEGDMVEVANQALTETMVRSLNNSFTIIFMLVALLLLGGSTVKWFATALLIGTVLGTYSSPFVAVPLLVSWDEVVERIKSITKRK